MTTIPTRNLVWGWTPANDPVYTFRATLDNDQRDVFDELTWIGQVLYAYRANQMAGNTGKSPSVHYNKQLLEIQREHSKTRYRYMVPGAFPR